MTSTPALTPVTRSTQLIAVEGSGASSGSILWWGLHGDVSYTALAQEWAAAGLPAEMLPAEPTPVRALSRAVNEFKARDTLVRALDEVDANGDPKTGFSLLTRTKDATTGKPAFVTSWEAWLPSTDLLAQGGDPLLATALGVEPDEEIVEVVTLRYRHELGRLSHTDLSSWLVTLVRMSSGVALRESGGVYFVPVLHIADWRRVGAVLAKVGAGRVHEAPVLRSDQAVSAILDSLMREAEEEVRELDAARDDASLGARALENRARRATAVDEKLRKYEELLGVQLDGMRERMSELAGRLMAAAMKLAPEAA